MRISHLEAKYDVSFNSISLEDERFLINELRDEVETRLISIEDINEEILSLENLLDVVKVAKSNGTTDITFMKIVDFQLERYKFNLNIRTRNPSLEDYGDDVNAYYDTVIVSLEGIGDFLKKLKDKIKSPIVEKLRSWKGKKIESELGSIKDNIREFKDQVKSSNFSKTEINFNKMDFGPRKPIAAFKQDCKTLDVLLTNLDKQVSIADALVKSTWEIIKGLEEKTLVDIRGIQLAISKSASPVDQLKKYDLINNYLLEYPKEMDRGFLNLEGKVFKVGLSNINKGNREKSDQVSKSDIVTFCSLAERQIDNLIHFSSTGYKDIKKMEEDYKKTLQKFVDDKLLAVFRNDKFGDTILSAFNNVRVLETILNHTISTYMFILNHGTAVIEEFITKFKRII